MQIKTLTFFFILAVSKCTCAQFFKVDTAINATDLIENHLLGKNNSGIAIENITYTGFSYTKGLFYYKSNFNALPMHGIILSTGNVIDVLGPNNRTASTENYLKGDNDLSVLYRNSKTFDAVIFEFDFISLTDRISFVFQFASEEYPEYVNKGVSDVFGFFVTDSVGNKINLAVINQEHTPITIDLINSKKNSQYYISNTGYERNIEQYHKTFFYENQHLFQFDGFTKPIHTSMKLEPFARYRFKIAIADIGDRKFDSWILIKGNSMISDGDKKSITEQHIENYTSFLKLDSLETRTDSLGYSIIMPGYFAYNSYDLTPELMDYLNKLLPLLEFSTNKLLIRGFTDESGNLEHNLKLSEYRAKEVMKFFIDQGIDQNRIEPVGMGELQNGIYNPYSRKVEIKVLKKAP
jgi:flagellar motor protein MotB